MKIVVQTFDIDHNKWYQELIVQLLSTDFEIIVVVSKSQSEKLFKFGKITYVYTPENLFEFVSFKKVHQYLTHQFIADDMYLFLHDTCRCGPDFNLKLNEIHEKIKNKKFDYAPLAINRKNAKHYINKYKTKFNICICSHDFMCNKNFVNYFCTPFSKKEAVAIELGNHNYSFRRWDHIIVDESLICQVAQDKKWCCAHGTKRLHNYIPIIDLHKYVSKAFLHR